MKQAIPDLAPEVANVVAAYPVAARKTAIELRRLIYEVAGNTDGVGPISETLKWGEPAYLTTASKSGTTIRIAWKEKAASTIALHVSCNTSLIDSFRERYSRELTFEGKRSIVLPLSEPLPRDALKNCILLAQTYHRR